TFICPQTPILRRVIRFVRRSSLWWCTVVCVAILGRADCVYARKSPGIASYAPHGSSIYNLPEPRAGTWPHASGILSDGFSNLTFCWTGSCIAFKLSTLICAIASDRPRPDIPPTLRVDSAPHLCAPRDRAVDRTCVLLHKDTYSPATTVARLHQMGSRLAVRALERKPTPNIRRVKPISFRRSELFGSS
ncbi:hypothetical protein THAOC_01641, partial [Thalassiosira oceanica]